jgi:hypothetical protein
LGLVRHDRAPADPATRELLGRLPDWEAGERLSVSTACHLWAFAALTGSPGARRYDDARRARGATHHQALRALANRLVGILHGCLRHRRHHDEQVAWPPATAAAAACLDRA